ncbi:peptidase M23 [Caballeronia sp. M23-90]
MMDAVDAYEATDGLYPIAADRRWHTGMHLVPKMYNEHIHAIADGEVIAYRVCQRAYDGGSGTPDTNAGFVLLKHTTETGEGRTLTFYSLYMHLLDLNGYHSLGADGKFLPEFLRMPSPGAGAASPIVSPAQSGEGKKVRRKDVLGLTGRCQEHPHLHVEIFMTKPDFEAYFGHTQLGREQVATPATTDYWGSSYYVIPPGQQFYPVPPGTDAKGSLHGIAFDRLHTGNNKDTLYVESYFHKGSKYTMVWRAAGQGKLEALTEAPVREADYEYNMYKRAMGLYPHCPSDGYEMLRFGRILSTPVTLAPPARGTWVRVSFAEGQEGYIDVSQTSILKLSDADFPFFKGWKKISEGAGLHSADGLCDIDALKKILSDTKARETAEEKAERSFYNKEDELVRYVKTHEPIRDALRGFVCEAPSEWDRSHNDSKFHKLKEAGEFYDGNEAGYNKFIKLLESLQFWDKTGLPAGEKLWFFHPMAFIRHFRKCGWLSVTEFAACLPRVSLAANVSWSTAIERAARHQRGINEVYRTYLNGDSVRLVHFLAQTFIETGILRTLIEDSRGRDQQYGPFYGRGYLQLTWPKNYDSYRKYRCLPDCVSASYSDPRITEASKHVWAGGETAHKWSPRWDPDAVSTNVGHAAHSSGMFWMAKTFRGTSNINRAADLGSSPSIVGFISWLVNGGSNGYAERQQFAALLNNVLGDKRISLSKEVLNYPPLLPPGQPILCRTFPPTVTSSSMSLIVSYAPQIP